MPSQGTNAITGDAGAPPAVGLHKPYDYAAFVETTRPASSKLQCLWRRVVVRQVRIAH